MLHHITAMLSAAKECLVCERKALVCLRDLLRQLSILNAYEVYKWYMIRSRQASQGVRCCCNNSCEQHARTMLAHNPQYN
jgi:hypothetical protein